MGFFLLLVFVVIIIVISSKKKSNDSNSSFENNTHRVSSVIEQPKIIITENPPKQPDPNDFSCTKESFQDEFGLYPNEILLLSYAPSYEVECNDFQSFWRYQYEIYDVKAKLLELVEKGFLEEKCDLERNLRAQKVPFLKDLLTSNNLPASGKKENLIEQIISNKDSIVLPDVVLTKRFALTEKGATSLKKSAYVEYIHKYSVDGLDLWGLNKLIHDRPGMFFTDVIWGYLNERSIDLISQREYGLYRNCRLSMFNMLYREERFLNAYHMLIEVIYWDIYGAIRDNYSFNNSDLELVLPTILGYMDELQEKLEISDDKLKEDFAHAWSTYSLPLGLTIEECIQGYFATKKEDVNTLRQLFLRIKKN